MSVCRHELGVQRPLRAIWTLLVPYHWHGSADRQSLDNVRAMTRHRAVKMTTRRCNSNNLVLVVVLSGPAAVVVVMLLITFSRSALFSMLGRSPLFETHCIRAELKVSGLAWNMCRRCDANDPSTTQAQKHCRHYYETRSQAVARVADRTATVYSNCC